MYKEKIFKKLLCMIIAFALVLTGSAFNVLAEEQVGNITIESDEMIVDESLADESLTDDTLTDEAALALDNGTEFGMEDSLSPSLDEETDSAGEDLYDEAGEDDTEHFSDDSEIAEDDMSSPDLIGDLSEEVDLTDSSLVDESLTDESLTDESLADESLADESLSDSSLVDESKVEEITVGSSDNIEEGLYVLESALTSNVCIGIANNSLLKNSNIELVKNTGGFGQAYYIKKTSDGYYNIINYHSNMALHVPRPGNTAGSNVVQYPLRDVNYQKWSIQHTSTGGYVMIQSVQSGLYLNTALGKSDVGTNINLNKKLVNQAREMWKLVPASGKVVAEARLVDANIAKGYYHICISEYNNIVANVQNASTKTGANIRLKTLGTSYSQAFLILPQGNGLYKVRNVRSGKYFATSDGTGGSVNIVQKTSSADDASQLWYILEDPDTGNIIFRTSNAKHEVMSSTGLGTGYNIYNRNYADMATQHWKLHKTKVYVKNAVYKPAKGMYYISPAASKGKAIGVASGSLVDMANVHLVAKVHSNTLKWRIIPNGDGSYRIQNVKSGKALDVLAANFAAGTNIHQYTVNGTDAQKWVFRYTGLEDGSFYIVSADNNYVLDIEGGKCISKSNVYLNHKRNGVTQRYILQKAGLLKSGWVTTELGNRQYYSYKGELLTGWVKLDGYYYYFYQSGVMARNRTLVYNSVTYVIDSEGKSNRTDVVTVTGGRTIRALLTNAVAPAGRVLYIWGGGHGGTDTSKIGILPTWTTFYNSHVSSSYDYNNYRWQYNMGLDCSGFVGWAVYNTLFTEDDVIDIDNTSTYIASDYISRGWCYDSGNTFKPGDIVSRSGHVWMSMGTCSDGSVLIMHSTPQGVQLSGTEGKSVELAAKYMGQIKKSTGWPFAVKQYGSAYLAYVGKATWKVDGSGIMSDPDGLQKKSAEEVCKIIFGY